MKTGIIQPGLFISGAIIFLASLTVSVLLDNFFFLTVPFILLFLYDGWKDPKTVFLFLLFTLPFSFEYDFGNGLATDIPDEGVMLILSFLVIATLINKPSLVPGRYFSHPLFVLLCCWIIWITTTAVLSEHPMISFKFLLAKTWYIGAFVFSILIWATDEKFFKAAILTLLSATLFAMFWILMRHGQLNFSFSNVNEAVRPLFRNHVNYSAMLVCMFPVLVGIFRLAKKRELRLFIGFFMTLLVFALFVAYARSAWIALLAGIMADWLIRKRRIIHFFILTVLVVIIGFWMLKKNDRFLEFAPHFQTTVFHPDFKEHLAATYKLKDISTAERFYRWIAGVRMTEDHVLTGFGPNTFYEEYKPYAIPIYKTWVSDNPEKSGVHNYYLLLAAEQGLPGLIIFLLLAGAMLYYSQRAYHSMGNQFDKNVALSAGVITVMILVLNFMSDLIETDKVGSLFFLCLGILISLPSHVKHREGHSPIN